MTTPEQVGAGLGEDMGASLRDRAGRASPEPASGLGHTATIPSAAQLSGPRYSPNLRAWLARYERRHEYLGMPRVYHDHDRVRWIGWIDEEEWFIGTRLWRTLTVGAKAGVGCWTFPVTDLTEEPDFWARYAEIGRCAIDEEHCRAFLNDEARWRVEGDARHCLWCGQHTQRLRRWTETVERERWEPASAMSAGTAETVQQAQGQRPASAVPKADAPALPDPQSKDSTHG